MHRPGFHFNTCATGTDFLGNHESQRANRLPEWASAREPLEVRGITMVKAA